MSATSPITPTSSTKPVQVKLVLLGEAAVGKSSLVLRFVSNEFQENKEPTIGAAFLTQKCRVNDKIIKYEIWDTAGQERFHSLAPMYYRNAQAAIVVYDISNAASFDKARMWVKELQRQANANIVVGLAGNKVDLEESRAVSTEEAAAYAEETGLTFMETSAKSNTNINAIFEEIAKKIPLDALIAKRARNEEVAGRAGVDMNRPSSSDSNGCGC